MALAAGFGARIKAARAVRIAAAYELSRRLIEQLHQNA